MIIGDFSLLRAKNVTVSENQTSNVHLVVKPVILVNNTKEPENVPVSSPGPPSVRLDDDCDDLISGNFGVSEPVNRVAPGYDVNALRTNSRVSSSNNLASPFSPQFNPESSIFKFKQVDNLNYDPASPEFRLSNKIIEEERLNTSPSNNIRRGIVRYEEFDLKEFLEATGYEVKYYRKVSVGNEIYSTQIFKQGLNVIILNRDKNYNKEYEETFDTNNIHKHSEKLANLIHHTSCNKIIILTGIGRWLGAVTPALVKQIKQIGGPDLNEIISFYIKENSDISNITKHAFLLIGRKGLCRFNGVWKVDNFTFKDFKLNPNDCFFEDLSVEHSRINTKFTFFNIVFMRMSININKDNRFYYKAPTVANITPNAGSVHGGLEVKIGGFNFGFHTTEIQNVMIKGVLCGDFLVLSPNLISCITRASTIIGPGPGSVSIVMKSGLSTPSKACFNFNYVGDKQDAIDDLNKSIRVVKAMEGRNLPIFLNSKTKDNDVKLFDNLLFQNIQDTSPVLNKDKNCYSKDKRGLGFLKVDSLVKSNYQDMIDMVNHNENVFDPALSTMNGKLRKSRFLKIVNNLN